ncbi:hypothetical protein SLA2020_203490 [Shorea laevis]
MMPVYGHMDSGPQHRNQVPFAQYYFPGVEAVPPHIKVDPFFQSPGRYEAWPHGSYYNYSVPSHGCCYHGNFPAYYGFRPPCAHFAPVPGLHCYGDYPPFPDACPAYYVPPQHHSMEQPRYEYDKDALRNHHCCGCPNHPWHQKNETSVKVEEQEPDTTKNEVKDVVPTQLRNYPYPIVGIPPESVKNQEDKKPFKSEVSDWDKAHGDTDSAQAVKSPEREPGVWSWFPLDMNGLKSSMEGEDGRKIQNQQNEGKMRQFPFPIIWMPYENQEDAKNQDRGKLIFASKYSEGAPTNFKFVPMEPLVKDGHMREPEANESAHAKSGSGITGQAADKKCIPVKQLEVQRMDNSEETERRGQDVIVKLVESDAKGKPSGTDERRQCSPPPKSKLPFVCLRVDPLPKKKNGNGSSRSLSPPRSRGQTIEKVKATIEPSAGQGLEEDSTRDKQTQNGSMSKVKGVEPKKKEIKTIQVIEKRSEDNKAEEHTCKYQAEILSSKHNDSQEEVCSKQPEKTKNVAAECKIEEAVRFEVATEGKKANDSAKSAHSECKAEKRQLSDVEAAMLLQSAYHGFEVRKSEPLKKLKQMTKVREQMAEVRHQIQALESSSVHKDDRHRLVIGEKIMGLLLKLDTIQGLHPSLRDIRKALAKELVTLQEKLDSLVSKQTEELVGELATSKLAHVMDDDGHKEVSLQEIQNKGTLGVDDNSFEHPHDGGKNAKEPVPEQVSCVIDVAPDSKGEETTELVVVEQELEEEQEKRTKESQLIRDLGCQEAESLPSMELEGETHNNCAPDMADILNNDVTPMLEHSVYLPSVPEKNISSDEFMGLKELGHDKDEDGNTQLDGENNGAPVTENPEGDKPRPLPLLKADELYAASGLEKQIGDGERETEPSAVEVNIPISSPLPVVTEISMRPEKDWEIDALKGLPIGVVEEECDGLETAEEEASKSEDGENNMTTESVPEIDGGVDMLKELPIGVVEVESEGLKTAKEEVSKSEEGENNVTTESVSEIDERVDLLKELLVGVVEEEREGHETTKEEASKSEEGENNMTTESASEIDEVPAASQSDEELVEADSGEWIKVSAEDMSNEFLLIHKPGELSSGDESTDRVRMAEGYHRIIPVDDTPSSELETGEAVTQEKEEMDVPLASTESEVVALEKNIQSEEYEHPSHEENAPPHKEIAEVVPVETHVSPEPSEEGEQSVDSLHPSATATQVSDDKHNTLMETDMKLIEENKRLREMMEKLMEAGKEQLTLISNLTGRIKDLERKLSVKKKTRKPGYRKPKCTTPRAKPSSSLRC